MAIVPLALLEEVEVLGEERGAPLHAGQDARAPVVDEAEPAAEALFARELALHAHAVVVERAHARNAREREPQAVVLVHEVAEGAAQLGPRARPPLAALVPPERGVDERPAEELVAQPRRQR